MSLAMIQFLVFAVEKFAASATNRQLMQKGVSTAFSVALKVGVVPSILSLQSFPVLESSSPELTSELHRIFPEHFPSPDNIQVQAPSPHRGSPARAGGNSPLGFHSPVSHGYSSESPVRNSPIDIGSPVTSPGRSPSHSESSVTSAGTSSDANSLSSSSFLPDNQQSPEPSAEISAPSALIDASTLESSKATDVPASLLVLGSEDFKNFQEMIPEPGSRPTEGFLECLNDIIISWIRQPNAVDLAAPLGSYLHASLEKIIVSSKISLSDLPKATCAGVFDSMLDQVLSEPQEVFVPFLQAMYARDITISFRLLAFCCSRSGESSSKSVDMVLAPYTAFLDTIGGNLTQNLVKDLTLSQHIDDARALACSLLGTSATKSSAAKDEVGAVEATVLFITPFLFAHMNHPSLGKLMGRSETLVQLLLGFATPSMLHALCTRLLLQEFAIFRHRLANVLLSSLQWNSWEQFGMWDLVLAEVQASHGSPSSAEKNFMAAARKVLACINPKDNAETMSGLMKCLVHFTPDVSVLQCIFRLSSAYEDFPIALLSCWIDKFPDVVRSYVVTVIQTAGDNTLTKDAVWEVLGKLEQLQLRRAAGKRSGHGGLQRTPVVTIMGGDDGVVASALRNIVSADNSSYPALAKLMEDHQAKVVATVTGESRSASASDDEPASKKQRLEGGDSSV